ncbi:hypothetical protein RHGRI_034342 [Rhododendron griersonianum]|uniref:Uncharacterized protein n=1 Tax=Rhododendron griersonianum TaxID=479676 RepID=A0AAV6I137_9ERIC|nr:hypothetical protein RHGRI_034342 [Rhododendron griersonianum]
MEQTRGEEIGIKIYNATPPNEEIPTTTAASAAADSGRKRRTVMAKGVQKTLSKTSLLANFLPTGTLLTFETLVPTVYRGGGACTHVTTLMIAALLSLCALSCFFFHFTDSFRGPDGRVYYGFVTPNGLAVFKPGIEVQVPKEERYRLGLSDFVHACMSALVFLAIAFSDRRVTGCLFPGHEKEMDEMHGNFRIVSNFLSQLQLSVFNCGVLWSMSNESDMHII